MGATAIAIHDLTKQYPAVASAPPMTAVDRVSLHVGAGELFFLLGPSGCGKTTLLRMIAGFIEPTSGTIEFVQDGQSLDITRVPAEQRETGMVFQSYALWPHMTVAQNVAFGLDVRRVPQQEKQQRVMEALAHVRMDQYADRKPTQLSGGQQQRVALARAMVVRPRVLLLDEPLSNLDAKLRIELRTEIRRVCKDAGMTGVYVTHDQHEALSMADRMAVLRAGKLVQVGTPQELYKRPGSRFVAEFLGETNIIPGKVISIGKDEVAVETPLGPLRSTSYAPDITRIGQDVQLSIRHEAIHSNFGTSYNMFQGTAGPTQFLGAASTSIIHAGGLELVTLHQTHARPALDGSYFVAPEDVGVFVA